MEFQTQAQEECYQKVSGWIREIFGEMPTVWEGIPAFGIRYGSAWTTTSVLPWGSDDAIIRTLSWVVTQTELTPDLTRHLLELNGSVRFGAFGVDEAGDIFFAHNVAGSTCQKQDLKTVVLAVMMTADEHDDQIVARWGGLRAVDLQ